LPIGQAWISSETTAFCTGTRLQRLDRNDGTTPTLAAAIFRKAEAVGWFPLESRRKCRVQLSANSCCTASSAGEKTEIRRARLPTRAISQETVRANRAACNLLLRIEDCRCLSNVPSEHHAPPPSQRGPTPSLTDSTTKAASISLTPTELSILGE